MLNRLDDDLRALQAADQLRDLTIPAGMQLGSNDYLGLSTHPEIRRPFEERWTKTAASARPGHGSFLEIMNGGNSSKPSSRSLLGLKLRCTSHPGMRQILDCLVRYFNRRIRSFRTPRMMQA